MQDAGREEQASRVKDFMNYQITEVMEEFDPDMDQLLFYLPLSGSCFKKIYFDEAKQRAVAKFVPAQDLVVSYAASDLQTAARVTHVLRIDANEVRKMQIAGFYMDVELSKYAEGEDEVRQKVDEIQGTSRTYTDDVYTILEMHVDLDLEGFEDMSPSGEPTGHALRILYDRRGVLGPKFSFVYSSEPLFEKLLIWLKATILCALQVYAWFGVLRLLG